MSMGFGRGSGCRRACVTGVSCFSDGCHVRGERPGRSRTGRSPAPWLTCGRNLVLTWADTLSPVGHPAVSRAGDSDRYTPGQRCGWRASRPVGRVLCLGLTDLG